MAIVTLGDFKARLGVTEDIDDVMFDDTLEEAQTFYRRLADESVGLRAANDNAKGFAPGGYMCNCNECGQRFTGAKHSWRCQPCDPQPS